MVPSITARPAEEPSAQSVSDSFVKQFYGILSKNPDQLYKFYKQPSVFSFCGDLGTKRAEGQVAIQALINSLVTDQFGGRPCKAECRAVEAHRTRAGGVMVLVTGTLVSAVVQQNFTQSFFLEKQTEPYDGYFVLNDILRYLPTPIPMRTMPLPFNPALNRVAANGGNQSPPVAPFVASAYTGAVGAAGLGPGGSHPVAPIVEPPIVQDDARQDARITSPPREQAPPIEANGESVPREEAATEVTQDDRVAQIDLDVEDDEDEEEEDAVEEDADADADANEDSPATASGAPAEIDTQDAGAIYSAEQIAADGEEQPWTWASMAGKLKQQGGGQLGPSTVQGFGVSGGHTKATSQTQAKASGAGSSSSRPASGQVWLWVSRLPTEPPVPNTEVLDTLNSLLGERAVESIDRRDTSQDWASISVTNQDAADTLCALSREKQSLLRGKALKVEPHKRPHAYSKHQNRGGGSDAQADGGGKGGRARRRARGGAAENGKDRFSGASDTGSRTNSWQRGPPQQSVAA